MPPHLQPLLLLPAAWSWPYLPGCDLQDSLALSHRLSPDASGLQQNHSPSTCNVNMEDSAVLSLRERKGGGGRNTSPAIAAPAPAPLSHRKGRRAFQVTVPSFWGRRRWGTNFNFPGILFF